MEQSYKISPRDLAQLLPSCFLSTLNLWLERRGLHRLTTPLSLQEVSRSGEGNLGACSPESGGGRTLALDLLVGMADVCSLSPFSAEEAGIEMGCRTPLSSVSPSLCVSEALEQL